MSASDLVRDPQVTANPISFRDVGRTGPATLAGRYLRRFWQPVFHSDELAPGTARPIRIMGQDYSLYRGETGAPHLVDAECPHRRMKMHAGWIEGDRIRCFYHGWQFDADGRCTEQPAERPPFCHKVQIGAYPARDYLGFIFCYLGEGAPPPFPRYPAFEGDDLVLTIDTYSRACHFFNNLENAGDKSHIAFAHHDASASWDETTDGPKIDAEESSWGVTFRTLRPSGKVTISQFGMPNIYHARGVPDDPEVQYREFLAWWVPHDDDRHTQFTVAVHNKSDPATAGYLERRLAKRARQTEDREAIARAILDGRMSWTDVPVDRVNMLFLQDDVAQMGVGPVAERGEERLGRGDAGLILQRKLWVRELQRLARGQPLKAWHNDPAEIIVQAEY
jgi:5,5'-dehydrodivanillate O-demethylase